METVVLFPKIPGVFPSIWKWWINVSIRNWNGSVHNSNLWKVEHQSTQMCCIVEVLRKETDHSHASSLEAKKGKGSH